MAAIHSGVVPQQPPTMFSQPLRANSPSDRGRARSVSPWKPPKPSGMPGVGVATDRASGEIAERLSIVRPHLVDAHGAVEPDAQRVEVRDRVIERLDRLRRERPAVCRRSCPRSSPAAACRSPRSTASMANRHAFRTSVSNDVSGKQDVDAAGDQGAGSAPCSWRPSRRRSRRGGRGPRRGCPSRAASWSARCCRRRTGACRGCAG